MPMFLGGRGGCIWAKSCRFVTFPMLCLLAFGDAARKSYFLPAFGPHKKGCDNDTFRAVFPSIWVSWDPQTLQNKRKHKMTNRPCFTPPQGGLEHFGMQAVQCSGPRCVAETQFVEGFGQTFCGVSLQNKRPPEFTKYSGVQSPPMH